MATEKREKILNTLKQVCELCAQYDEYRKHTEERAKAKEWDYVLNHTEDGILFKQLLKESIERAEAAGVKEENILHNREEIDNFFES